MTIETSIGQARPEPPEQGHLVWPADNAVIEGRSLLFRWDFHHAKRISRYRLTILRCLAGQGPAEALRAGDVALEAVVEHVAFLAVDAGRLKAAAAAYAWQVEALDQAGAVVALSDIRTFGLAAGRLGPHRFIGTSGDEAPETSETVVVAAAEAHPGGERCETCCPNGGLEDGAFTGWQCWSGSRLFSSTINLNQMVSGQSYGRHAIVTAGNDGNLATMGAVLPRVGIGDYAAQINNEGCRNGEVSMLSYTFTVTEHNKYFTFRYALVLSAPDTHPPEKMPFFTWYVKRGPGIIFSSGFGMFGWANMLLAIRSIVADASNPFFKSVDGVVYRDWTPVCLDLSPYLGQTLTVVFATASCWYDLGHYGYAYIDGVCESNEPVPAFTVPKQLCRDSALWADGAASTNETSHFWSIEESDANWGRNPTTEKYQWFIGDRAGQTNLTQLYTSLGGVWKCNTWYRIKLAVSNDCVPWAETVQLVYIACPPLTAGPDMCVSCTPNGQSVQLGVGNTLISGTSYLWEPTIGLDDPLSPSPMHQHGSVTYPATYTVKVTDAKGCTNTDSVTLFCQKPRGEIVLRQGCCGAVLTVNVTGGWSSITWSNGVTNLESISITQSGIYTAVIGNACGTYVAQITVPAFVGLTGPFNPVAAESKINPTNTSSLISNVMHIKDVVIGSPAGIAGVPNAYNATDYRLMIFDRWGNQIRTIQGSNCEGFLNWSIQWDGRNDNGVIVQQDTYSWKLCFMNCDRKEWEPAKVRSIEKRCKRWATLFGINLWCREWEYFFFDDGSGIGSVTVIH